MAAGAPGIRRLDDLDVRGKRVLVRLDLNVPMDEGVITDKTRIARVVPTLKELLERGAALVVISHFGRPKGKRQPSMSLEALAAPLSEALGGRKVAFAEDCIGEATAQAARALEPGDVLLLENLRFHPEEEKNDKGFAAALAGLADAYVNDAFSASHRAHASVAAVAQLLPSAAGRLMEQEVVALSRTLVKPERPLAAIVGGAKISTKLELLSNLVKKVNFLIVGGGMANTFLAAGRVKIGKSLCEHAMLEAARTVIEAIRGADCALLLPVDAVIAREFRRNAPSQTVLVNAVPEDAMILDLGPRTVQGINHRLRDSRSLVWNGPLGAFELPPFDRATNEVAREAARLTKAGTLLSVAGGGDTVAALAHAGVVDDFSYVSTAGGAFLEWLEGKPLPGVEALRA